MLERNIKKHLSKKLDRWITTISDKELREDIARSVMVTGGAITSLVRNEEVNDYDIYFKDRGVLKRVAEHYTAKYDATVLDTQEVFKYVQKLEDPYTYLVEDNASLLRSIKFSIVSNYVMTEEQVKCNYPLHDAWVDSDEYVCLDEDKPFTLNPEYVSHQKIITFIEEASFNDRIYVFIKSDGMIINKDANPEDRDCIVQCITSNAISLTDGVQIITRFHGDAEEIHSNFDFDHCKGVYDHHTGDLHIADTTYECIINQHLRYSGSKYPLASIIRTRKFVARGFTIDAGQYVKMALQLNNLDLNNPGILAEQLVGVDLSYFSWLIEAINSCNIEDDSESYVQLMLRAIFDDDKDAIETLTQRVGYNVIEQTNPNAKPSQE